MRILFISATAGEGHNNFAKALMEYYQHTHKDIEVKLIDLYKPHHKVMAYLINDFSFFMFRNFPHIMSFNYRVAAKTKVNPNRNNSLYQALFAKKTILKEIDEFKPDLIFTTHTYSTALINYLNRKKIIDIPSYSLIPDFVIHPDVENNIDSRLCFVSNKEVYDNLISRGFDKDKVIISGLPIKSSFYGEIEPFSYDLDKDKKVILVLFGGMGLHKNHKIVKRLESLLDDNYIVVINGKDKRSYKKLQKMNHPHLINIQYSDEIASIMKISDVMIGKIGGSSTSEALQFSLPVIAPFMPYYQENESIKLLNKYGLVKRSSLTNLYKDVTYVLNKKLTNDQVSKIHNYNSTQIICESILNDFKSMKK